jgi:membrane peptidoglycan carboxypeptidase
MGNDNNEPLIGVTGGGLPAEIWSLIMNKIHTDLKPHPLPKNKIELALFPNVIDSEYQPKTSQQGASLIDKLLLTLFGEE